METIINPNDQISGPPPSSRGERKPLFKRHRGLLLILALATVFLATQWPMLKNAVYSALKIAPPSDGIAWRTDYTSALAESKQTGKPVLLDFSATWCPPCQAMKRDVWPDPRVGRVLTRSYIPVALDVDKPANFPPARRYGVETIPFILIVDSDGRVLKQGNFMSADEMLDFLQPEKNGPT